MVEIITPAWTKAYHRMDDLANGKLALLLAINRRIEEYLERVARDFDRKALNPPREICIDWVEIPEKWISVGYIPKPHTRLGWFTYHLIHGLAMRYPLRSVIAFSLLHTKPYGNKAHLLDQVRIDKEVAADEESDQANPAGSLAR